MKYWLFKTEPESYSIDDLQNDPDQITCWDGVRNYQARNFLRDEVKAGDQVLLYHSSTDPPAIVGIAKVTKAGYPDHTAFDETDPHYDPKSKRDQPTWYMVDIQLERVFAQPLTLDHLRTVKALEKMELLRKGSRLSIQPVTAAEYKTVLKQAGVK
jgi:predicted RNA-binding protein with PUA-like domain